MDLATLGLNTAAAAMVIAITKLAIMLFDPGKKLERWYPLLPFLFAVAPAVMLTKPLVISNWQAISWAWLSIGGVAAWAYKTGKTTILGK